MMQSPAAAVAVFEQHADAEDAVRTLERAGIALEKMSIVARGYEAREHVVGYYNTGDRVKFWGGNGALWGGIWGLLLGSAFLTIPGVGPVIVAGPFVAAIASALESAVIIGGLSAVGAALYSIGIPKDSVLRYETALRADKYLVLVNGTAEEVAKASDVLRTAKATSVEQHPLDQKAAA
jgi:hypothetical protein